MLTRAFTFVFFLICFQASAQSSLRSFDFLIGPWSLNDSKGKIVESWARPSLTRLEGIAYRVSPAGDTTLMETIVIRQQADDLYYIVSTPGQSNDTPVYFKLITASNGTHVFENKENEFPQRIVYELRSPDELLAWIEGKSDGKEMKIEFPYKREKE